jgi:hypothetical protein
MRSRRRVAWMVKVIVGLSAGRHLVKFTAQCPGVAALRAQEEFAG